MFDAALDLRALEAHLTELERRERNMAAPIAAIGEAALKENSEIFALEGPGWAPSTSRGKTPGTPTMVESGRLARSYTKKGAPGNVHQVGPKSGQFGSSVPYAEELQRGGSIKVPRGRGVPGKKPAFFNANLPARPVVKDPVGEFLAEIDREVSHHFDFDLGAR